MCLVQSFTVCLVQSLIVCPVQSFTVCPVHPFTVCPVHAYLQSVCLYSVFFTVSCTVCIVQCVMYSVLCTVCYVQCVMYSVQLYYVHYRRQAVTYLFQTFKVENTLHHRSVAHLLVPSFQVVLIPWEAIYKKLLHWVGLHGLHWGGGCHRDHTNHKLKYPKSCSTEITNHKTS